MGLEGEVRGRFKCCGVVGLSEREVVGKNIHARVTSVIPGRSIGTARDCRLASMWPQQPRVNVIALSLTTFHQHNHQVLHRVSGCTISNGCKTFHILASRQFSPACDRMRMSNMTFRVAFLEQKSDTVCGKHAVLSRYRVLLLLIDGTLD
jgi:hypothetical protein